MSEEAVEFQEVPNRYEVKPKTPKSGVYQGVSANEVRKRFRREAEIGSKLHQEVANGLRTAFKSVRCGVDTYDEEGRIHSVSYLDGNVVREIAAIIIEDQRYFEAGGRPEDSLALENTKQFLRRFRALELASKEMGEGVFVKASEEVATARRIEGQMESGEEDISEREASKFIGDCQKTLGAFLKSLKGAEAEQAKAQAEERVKAKEEKKRRNLRLLDALEELAKTKV